MRGSRAARVLVGTGGPPRSEAGPTMDARVPREELAHPGRCRRVSLSRRRLVELDRHALGAVEAGNPLARADEVDQSVRDAVICPCRRSLLARPPRRHPTSVARTWASGALPGHRERRRVRSRAMSEDPTVSPAPHRYGDLRPASETEGASPAVAIAESEAAGGGEEGLPCALARGGDRRGGPPPRFGRRGPRCPRRRHLRHLSIVRFGDRARPARRGSAGAGLQILQLGNDARPGLRPLRTARIGSPTRVTCPTRSRVPRERHAGAPVRPSASLGRRAARRVRWCRSPRLPSASRRGERDDSG